MAQRAWRPPPADALLAGALATWSLVEIAALGGGGAVWARVLTGLAMTVPLAWRRTHPIAVGALVLAMAYLRTVVIEAPEPGATPLPSILVSMFSVALHARHSVAAALAGAAMLAGFIVLLVGDYYSGGEPATVADVLLLIFFLSGTWVVGWLLRGRTAEARHARERGEARAAEAAAAERARLARELHDVVAHSVSIIAVQAGGAEHLIERDPAAARASVQAIHRTAHEALEELRRLMGILREDEPALAPQPGLERLEELAEQARGSGHPVWLDAAGNGEVPAGVGLAAYRIVQEALTNVRKHAGPVPTRVAVRREDGELVVEIANDPGSRHDASGAGLGLGGMRERARLYGGVLDAGPDGAGGWVVRARLPLEDAA